jgi:hypothetical protein
LSLNVWVNQPAQIGEVVGIADSSQRNRRVRPVGIIECAVGDDLRDTVFKVAAQ